MCLGGSPEPRQLIKMSGMFWSGMMCSDAECNRIIFVAEAVGTWPRPIPPRHHGSHGCQICEHARRVGTPNASPKTRGDPGFFGLPLIIGVWCCCNYPKWKRMEDAREEARQRKIEKTR